MGNGTKAVINVIVGIVLVVVGVAWYFVNIPYLSTFLDHPISFSPFWKILAILILGVFGIGVFFIGLILAWMGWDDYKMAKEMVKEDAEKEEPQTKEEELEAELRTQMAEEVSGFTCDVCGKVLKTKAGLSAHKRSHK